MNKILLLTALLLTGLSSSAQYVLDQHNTGFAQNRSIVDNIQSCIQTFTAGMSGALVEVRIDIETGNCPYPIVCNIHDGGPSGNIIATELLTLPINTSRSIQSIAFSIPAIINAGNTYAISLNANCVSGPGYSVWWYKSVNDGYTNGQAYTNNGGTLQPEDSLNDFYFQTYMLAVSGIGEYSTARLSIGPNPATTSLTLRSFSSSDLEICSAGGQVVLAFPDAGMETTLDISGLHAGLYFIRSVNRQGIAVRKFIKL